MYKITNIINIRLSKILTEIKTSFHLGTIHCNVKFELILTEHRIITSLMFFLIIKICESWQFNFKAPELACTMHYNIIYSLYSNLYETQRGYVVLLAVMSIKKQQSNLLNNEKLMWYFIYYWLIQVYTLRKKNNLKQFNYIEANICFKQLILMYCWLHMVRMIFYNFINLRFDNAIY